MGICSTTYGDLVCRGCKRFAHEIVQWNGYDEHQQQRVWERLHHLRAEVIEAHVCIEDAQLFALVGRQAGLNQLLQGAELIHRQLGFMGAKGMPLSAGGLVAIGAECIDALSMLQRIDREIYQRSLAHYERNFKVRV